MSVEYREIERFPGYRFGSDGSAWSRWKRCGWKGQKGVETRLTDEWRQLSTNVSRRTYSTLSVRNADGKIEKQWLHRLILEAFCGPPSFADAECCHGNGDPTDNRIDNLRWGTAKENRDDSARHGTKPFGERSGRVKLTESQVLEIRAIDRSEEAVDIAKRYGVSVQQIQRILRGLTWKHLGLTRSDGTRRGERHPMRVLTEDAVRQIRSLRGIERQRDIAKRFGVSHATVAHIHTGRLWGHLT